MLKNGTASYPKILCTKWEIGMGTKGTVWLWTASVALFIFTVPTLIIGESASPAASGTFAPRAAEQRVARATFVGTDSVQTTQLSRGHDEHLN